jgi:uncharacterized protein YbbK (DUF523 family)
MTLTNYSFQLPSIAQSSASPASSGYPVWQSRCIVERQIGDCERSGQVELIKVGISACLLGAQVRFDGGHKRDPFLVETIGRFVQWIPVCPEVEIGLGVPRPSMRLVDSRDGVRLVEWASASTSDAKSDLTELPDYTERMRAYARERVAALLREGLCGYVLKSNSPSCGMEHVKIYQRSGAVARAGRGLFAETLMHAWPNLPVEEEGGLADPARCENFIERLLAYHGLRSRFRGSWNLGDLVAFHNARKLQLLSHSTGAYEALSRMVARGSTMAREALRADYEREFMVALRCPATRARHTTK